jgi:hypothetical protein
MKKTFKKRFFFFDPLEAKSASHFSKSGTMAVFSLKNDKRE